MIIWIDGDACPNEIKDIVYRASIKKQIKLNYIANSYQRIPKNSLFSLVIVERSPDAADQYILDNLKQGDIVITADIPLASEALKKGAPAINPKGIAYTESNIREKLAMRNLMEELRSAGTISGGPKPLDNKDKTNFANALDRLIHKN